MSIILGRRLVALAGGFAAAITLAALPAAAQDPLPENPELRAMIGAADVSAGIGTIGQCIGCHVVTEGTPSGFGPNLYGVVGAPIGHLEGYNYSPAMQALNAAGRTWTYEELDAFIESPMTHIPGTAMPFGGVPDPQVRANMIAYLRTLAAEPAPLEGGAAPAAAEPAAVPAEPAAPAAAPAGGGLMPITFTSTEASRGRSVYNSNCAGCHTGEAGGRVGPLLTSPEGFTRWAAGSVGTFHAYIKSAMPLDEPGSLSDEQYLQIVAYLAQTHGATAGDTPLPADGLATMGFSN